MLPERQEPSTFRQRIAHAGIWSIGGYGVAEALRLVSNLVLTRILAPEMFGIMAIANLIMIGLALFSDE